MLHRSGLGALVALVAFLACHTIHEELPAATGAVSGAPGSPTVIIVGPPPGTGVSTPTAPATPAPSTGTAPTPAPMPLAVPAAVCEGFVPAAHLGKALAGMMERFAQLGVAAAFDAWRDAGLPRSAEPSAFASADAGVCWGTSMSNIVAIERGYRDFWEQGRERIPPMMVVMGMSNSVAAHISIQLGLANAALTYSMACASGAIQSRVRPWKNDR